MQRDRQNNHILENEGWIVLRFWEHEINKELDKCLNTICSIINKQL